MMGLTETYDVRVMDGDISAGEDTIEAGTLDEAIALAITWAEQGDWDHPGTVRVVLSRSDVDIWEQEVSVGPVEACEHGHMGHPTSADAETCLDCGAVCTCHDGAQPWAGDADCPIHGEA